MNCPKCKQTGIKNHANNKEFYYCRKCKQEILQEEDMLASEQPLSQKEIDEIFNDLYWGRMATQSPYKPFTTLEEYEQECLSISPHWSDKE